MGRDYYVKEVCWRPVRQLLASCRALRPGWPVGVPPPSAETQAPLSGTPGARVHSHALPSWAHIHSHPLRDPYSYLSGHYPCSCLLPPHPSGLQPGITPALTTQVLDVHSFLASFDRKGWGPGPCTGLKGKGQGGCFGSCNCRVYRRGAP